MLRDAQDDKVFYFLLILGTAVCDAGGVIFMKSALILARDIVLC